MRHTILLIFYHSISQIVELFPESGKIKPSKGALKNGIEFSTYTIKPWSMVGLFDRNNKYILNDTSFETFYKWNSKWIPITVTPITHIKELMYYIINLPDDSVVLLQLDEKNEWVEVKNGPTEKSWAIGEAIDNFHKLVLS